MKKLVKAPDGRYDEAEFSDFFERINPMVPKDPEAELVQTGIYLLISKLLFGS